ncbi:hypothetical protein H1164_01970 [Thermoactinomyces daqus]|uniref:Protein kinase domain-containing protein n=1 Tax=Thermoactinomyces daqus TaxID=1329516 RepID=A0A7W1X7W2_9BACL|nr:hypothetical protein [Thermoactinomyces daqus]MBA4541672.1 hypothetical protein [Thermoactinomyces daqus]
MKQPFSLDRKVIETLSEMVLSGAIEESYPLLGEGLSGKVYDYEGYAVKVFKENYSENDDDRVLNYMRGHSAFPTLYYKERQGRFLVVEKVSGHTLGEMVKAGGKLPDRYYWQLEKYAEDCYKKGIIPSDLHLNNMMVDQDNRIRIVDTGRFFFTRDSAQFKEKVERDLEILKYYCGFFSSSSWKKHRRHRRHYHYHSYLHSHSHSHSYSRSHSSSSHRRHRHHRHHHHFFSS